MRLPLAREGEDNQISISMPHVLQGGIDFHSDNAILNMTMFGQIRLGFGVDGWANAKWARWPNFQMKVNPIKIHKRIYTLYIGVWCTPALLYFSTILVHLENDLT